MEIIEDYNAVLDGAGGIEITTSETSESGFRSPASDKTITPVSMDAGYPLHRTIRNDPSPEQHQPAFLERGEGKTVRVHQLGSRLQVNVPKYIPLTNPVINNKEVAVSEVMSNAHESPWGSTFAISPVKSRHSRRGASMPSVPSPLGPRNYTDDLGSDVSGLVQSPNTTDMRQSPEKELERTPYMAGRISSGLRGDSGFSQHLNYNHRALPTLFLTPQTARHVAQLSDPFVSTPIQPAASSTHSRPEGTSPAIQAPDFQAFQYDRRIQPQPDLPIPPPPLSELRGRITQTAQARQQLDAQKIDREIWIRREARKIANLNRAKFDAEQNWHETGTPEAFAAWQQAIQSFNQSVDLEKRQEERRNLFLPGDMKALRMGDDGQGKLLGYEMALMERQCAVAIGLKEGRLRD